MTHMYGPTGDAPEIQIRCPVCGRCHNDRNFTRCVECGRSLEGAK